MDSTKLTVGASYSGSNATGTVANATKTSTAGSEKYVATAVNKTATITIEGISLKITINLMRQLIQLEQRLKMQPDRGLQLIVPMKFKLEVYRRLVQVITLRSVLLRVLQST